MCDAVNLYYLKKHLTALKSVRRVLEVGSFNVNGNCKAAVLSRGLEYVGADIRNGPDVDLVCDITGDPSDLRQTLSGTFDLVICMNVLEHLFEPVKALDNMVSLLTAGGYIMIVTPTVWDLHDWPHDFFRLNPDFFRRFAELRSLLVVPGTFVFSTRDSGRFFDDLSVLPMVVPEMHPSLAARGARRLISRFLPEMRECWTRIYLNLIYQKPIAG